MLTLLGIIVGGMAVVWLGIKIFPFLWRVVSTVMSILTLPFALLGGCLGFIIEIAAFFFLMWLCSLFFGIPLN